MRKHKLSLFIMCAGAAVMLVFTTFRPLYIRDLVDVFTASQRDSDQVWRVFLEICGIAVITYIARQIYSFANGLFEARVMKELDERSFAVMQRQSICFFEESKPGSLMQWITNFRNSFEGITDILFQDLGRSVVVMSIVFIILLYNAPEFALLAGIWMVVFLAFTWLFTRYQYPFETAESQANSRVSGELVDSLGNSMVVKAFGAERSECGKFRDVSLDCYKKRVASWFISDVGGLIQGVLMITAELGFIFWTIRRWEAGLLPLSQFVMLQSYVAWILGELRTIGYSVRRLFSLIANAQEMADLYHREIDVKDEQNARPLTILKGEIEIHELAFRYEGGSVKEEGFVLNNINITIPAGQSVGIVGRTGAGKSTLVKLLLRLCDPSLGYILIDGQDISSFTQESLRQQMAIVPQQPQLFHRSIRDNIAFACPDATEEDIVEAARKAHAWGFIQKLDKGLDSTVGDRGVKLSGGECQRISIARAILADPKILILDEATSSQDGMTEKGIQLGMASLLRGRTSFVVAHRLSTLRRMDRILVIEDGEIIEDGSHKELLKAKGLYADLWNHQVDGCLPVV